MLGCSMSKFSRGLASKVDECGWLALKHEGGVMYQLCSRPSAKCGTASRLPSCDCLPPTASILPVGRKLKLLIWQHFDSKKKCTKKIYPSFCFQFCWSLYIKLTRIIGLYKRTEICIRPVIPDFTADVDGLTTSTRIHSLSASFSRTSTEPSGTVWSSGLLAQI